MIRKKEAKTGPIIIDLTGPDGNAYALMAYAKRFARELGLDSEEIISNMMSGDYDNLIQVFDNEFGSIVILEK